MYVKPADRKVEGRPLVVRDPDLLDLLPAEGREVPDSLYWQRRLIEGDVVLVEELAPVPAGSEWKPQPGGITDSAAYAKAIEAGTIREIPAADAAI